MCPAWKPCSSCTSGWSLFLLFLTIAHPTTRTTTASLCEHHLPSEHLTGEKRTTTRSVLQRRRRRRNTHTQISLLSHSHKRPASDCIACECCFCCLIIVIVLSSCCRRLRPLLHILATIGAGRVGHSAPLLLISLIAGHTVVFLCVCVCEPSAAAAGAEAGKSILLLAIVSSSLLSLSSLSSEGEGEVTHCCHSLVCYLTSSS